MMTRTGCRAAVAWSVVSAACILTAACGAAPTPAVTPAPAPPGTLIVSPQNDSFSVGRNRLSVVIQDAMRGPVLGAMTTVEVRTDPATTAPLRPLTAVGPDYPDLPIYTGIIDLPHAGTWLLVVHTTSGSGAHDAGQAFITAAEGSLHLQVGSPMPAIVQPVLGPGETISSLDSGVPPDPWHDMTVAAALTAHRPMVVFVGEPGRCLTKTCGDTIIVLRRLCESHCRDLVFEHIEVHHPADSQALNPAWIPFHFEQEQPWVYFVSASGLITDAFEGPAPLSQLAGAAEGTVAGRVPAA